MENSSFREALLVIGENTFVAHARQQLKYRKKLDSIRLVNKHGAYRRRFNKIALPVRELQDQLMMYCTVPVDVDEI